MAKKKDDMINVVPEEEEKEVFEAEEDEDIDEFDLEALIVEGSDAILKRKVEYFSLKANKIRSMYVYVTPLTHSEWEQKARLTGKKTKKNIEQLICASGWVHPDGMPVELSEIRRAEKGVVTSVYEEIKLVSGQTHDTFQDAFLEKVSDF